MADRNPGGSRCRQPGIALAKNMAEDEGKKDEFEFDAAGEALGYISLEQARVVAMRTAREEPGNYGRTLSHTRMAYQLVEQENGEDYYIVTLSFRPEGDFVGTEGQEQFFIEKEGTVAYRQVMSLPKNSGSSSVPVVPIGIGLVVALGAAIAIALGSGIFAGGQKDPNPAVSLSTTTPGPLTDGDSTPSPDSGNGLTPGNPAVGAPAAQVKFPGFDFQLAEGAFWEYKWETESSSFCRDCPRGSRKESGTFLVSLGPPKVIRDVTAYQVRLSGEYKKKDGKILSFAPPWKYIGVSDNKIVASENGTTFVVIFDGENGEWQGGGFFSSRFGTDAEMSARQGQIPDPISQWTEVRQGPVLAVGQSSKDGECRFERLTGTTVCDANRSTTSQSELFRKGVGPVGYFFRSNFSSGSGSTSFSASSAEYVGLTSSSLLGDVPADGSTRTLTTPSSGLSSQLATTAPGLPEQLPGSGVSLFATPVPTASIRRILTTPIAPVRRIPRPSDSLIATSLPPDSVTSGEVAWKALSPTWGFTCGLTSEGQAYCWGNGKDGVLGNDSEESTVIPVPVSGGLTFESISARAGHTCGVTTGGEAYCWGEGGNGALGNGSTDDQNSPVPVAGGLTFQAVSAMGAHTCGVTTLGEAYCWGRGNNGRLGNGSTDFQTTPVLVAGGLRFGSMSGSAQTCGVTTQGAAYCWGAGGGALGTGSFDGQVVEPAPVLGNLTFMSLGTGHESTCGLTVQGAVYCWGSDAHGRLGNGPAGDSTTPALVVGGLAFTSLTSGADQVCGIANGGAAYCWGRGQEGQLGNGSTADQDRPTLVSGGLTFASISAGTGITCGVTTDGAAYCWGDGYRGQLGTGKTELTVVPVRVADPG